MVQPESIARELRLSRQRRIPDRGTFTHIMARPPRVKSPFFLIFAEKNGRTIGRLGLVVSRKVSLKAVERNRIKRLIRESYRTSETDLKGLDIVVLARQSATRLNNNRLREEIAKYWREIGSNHG